MTSFYVIVLYMFSKICISSSNDSFHACLATMRDIEKCNAFINKHEEPSSHNQVFVQRFKEILLQKVGLDRSPNISVSISPAEKEYVINVTEQIEEKSHQLNLKHHKIDIIYPEFKKKKNGSKRSNQNTSKHEGPKKLLSAPRRLLFWLPDCNDNTCTINVAKMRVVLRIKKEPTNLSQVTLNIILLNEQKVNLSVITQVNLKLEKHTMLVEIDLGHELKSYTGKKAIAVVCEDCEKNHVTPAKQTLRYGKQRSSLTILWKKQKGIVARDFRNICKDCCRLRIKLIKFKDIGWDHWIISPSEVLFGYCHGICKDPRTLVSDYSYLVETLRTSSYAENFTELRCCVPTRFERITLIYAVEPSVIKRIELNRLVASQCGCM